MPMATGDADCSRRLLPEAQRFDMLTQAQEVCRGQGIGVVFGFFFQPAPAMIYRGLFPLGRYLDDSAPHLGLYRLIG